MDDFMKELNLEEMGKVSGGNLEEAKKYQEYLMTKYGTTDYSKLNTLITREEVRFMTTIYTLPDGEPVPPYPA